MHVVILIIAIILVGGGILVRSKTTIKTPSEEVVLGKTVPTHIPTITPTPTPPKDSTHSNDFIYPGATIKSQSGNSTSLTSTDDAQVITDWYKNKIKEMGMSTRSFVQTKTNDNIHNVLAAGKKDDEIKITITKTEGEAIVSITVER